MPEQVVGGMSNVGGGSTLFTSSGKAIKVSAPDPRFSTPRFRGSGGGSSRNQTPAAVQYRSELLGQTFATLEAKEAAETQFKEQQAQTIAREQSRQQDIRQQRQSITARGSQIVQVGTDTPEGYKQAGITSSISKAQSVPFFQRARTFITDPETRAGTVTRIIDRPFGRTGEKVTGSVGGAISRFGQRFSTATTQTERQFESQTQQEIKSFEGQVESYSKEVEGYNKAVESFQKRYGEKELTPEQYNRAVEERAILERVGAKLESKQTALSAREEQIKSKVEGYESGLAEARKKSPFLERASVGITKGVGDVISTVGFLTEAIGKPGETQREIAKTASLKDVVEPVKLDPLGSAIQIGTGFAVGTIASKLIGKTANIVKAAKTETNIAVSVGDIKAVKVPGQPNLYRVSGKAVGEVRDLSGKTLGRVTTNTEAITVSARTAEEATRTYTQGVASSFAQAGADTSRLRVGVSSIEGEAVFSKQVAEGLVQGKAIVRIDDILKGKTKPVMKNLPSNVDVVGLRFEGEFPLGSKVKTQVGTKLKLKEDFTNPRAFVSESFEKAVIDTPKIRQTLVDTRSLGSQPLGVEVGFKRPEVSIPKVTVGSFERDVVNLLKKDIKSPEYIGITFEEVEVPRSSTPKSSKPLQTAQALDLDLKAVEQQAIQSTRSVTTKATQDLQKQIRKQNIVDATRGRTRGSVTGQLTKNEIKELEKSISRGASATVQTTRKRDKGIVTGLNFEALSYSPSQSQIPRQSQAQRSALKQLAKVTGVSLSALGIPSPPSTTTPRGFIGFDLPSRGQGGGTKESKVQKRKGFKTGSGYAASLAAAAVQINPVKVTRKQYERLKKTTFSGIEARPVLQIVDDKNIEKSLKTAVQF